MPLAQQLDFLVGTAPLQVLGSNPRRRGVIIGADRAADLWVRFGGTTAGIGVGILVPHDTHALRLHYDEIGELILMPISIVATANGAFTSIVEYSHP